MSPLKSYRAWAEMHMHFLVEKSKEDAVEAFCKKDPERFIHLTENTCYIRQFWLALHPIEYQALDRRSFVGASSGLFSEASKTLSNAQTQPVPASELEQRINRTRTLLRKQKPRNLAKAFTEEAVLRKGAITSLEERLQHLVNLKLDDIEEPEQWFFDRSMNPYPYEKGKLRVPIEYGDRDDWAHDTLSSKPMSLPQSDSTINNIAFGDVLLPRPMILTNEAGYKCLFHRNHGFVGRDNFVYLSRVNDNPNQTHQGFLGLTETDYEKLPSGMAYFYDEMATAPLSDDAHFRAHARGYNDGIYTLKPENMTSNKSLLALCKNGNECLTPFEFQNAYDWYGGYWLQAVSGKWGYYSLTSGWLYQPIFDDVPQHMYRHYLAHIEGRAGVLDNETYSVMLDCIYVAVHFVPPYGRGRGMEGYFVAEDAEGKFTLFDNEGQQQLEPLSLGAIPATLQGQVEEQLLYTRGKTHEEQVSYWLRDLDRFNHLIKSS